MVRIKKVLIIDPGMFQREGHHHSLNLLIQKGLNSFNKDHSFFFSNLVSNDILKEYQSAFAFFSYDIRNHTCESFSEGTADFFDHAFGLFNEMHCLNRYVTTETLIFGHTITANSLLALSLWYASLPEKKKPYLALTINFLRDPPNSEALQCFSMAASNFGVSKKVRLFSAIDQIVDMLVNVTGMSVHVLPIPFQFSVDAFNKTKLPLTYGVVGSATYNKNFNILPQAITKYIKNGGSSKFLVQLAPIDSNLIVQRYMKKLLRIEKKFPEKITFIPSYLETYDAYIDFLSKISVILLPYNPRKFHNFRNSQVFQEACCLNIPAIVSEGGNLRYEVDKLKNGSLVMGKPNPKNLTSAMFTFEKSLSSRLEAASLVGYEYRKFNNLNNFIRTILNVGEEMHKVIVEPSDKIKSSVLLGPYIRSSNIYLDDTNAVHSLFNKKKDGIMIDVGAHHGSAFLEGLRKNWKIFAFEPDKINMEKLIIRLKDFPNKKNVVLDNRAVSDVASKNTSFYCSEESTGISGLLAFRESHKKAQKVEVTTLSESLPVDLTDVDFLKIDTEGYDFMVLKGVPWDRFKPTVVECEFEDSKTVSLGYTYEDIADYLEAKGYEIYVSEWCPIIRYGIKHQWCALKRYPCKLERFDAWGNLIAVKKENFDQSAVVAAFKKILKVSGSSMVNQKLSMYMRLRNAIHNIQKDPGMIFYYTHRFFEKITSELK